MEENELCDSGTNGITNEKSWKKKLLSLYLEVPPRLHLIVPSLYRRLTGREHLKGQWFQQYTDSVVPK
jgi:hypothetical protein